MSKDPRLERNYFLALILSMAVLLAYPFYLKWSTPDVSQAPEQVPTEIAPTLPEVKHDLSLEAPGRAVLEKSVPATTVPFENRFYEASFSNQGATMTRLFYKGDHEHREIQTLFFEQESGLPGSFGLKLLDAGFNLDSTIFKLTRRGKMNEIFDFVYEKPHEFRLTKTFVFSNEKPTLELRVLLENLSDRQRNFSLEIDYGLNQDAPSADHPVPHEAVAFADGLTSQHADKIAKKGFAVTGNIRWAGLVKKYFSLLVRPEKSALAQAGKVENQILWGELRLEPMALPAGGSETADFLIYAGPSRYELLKEFGYGFEDVLGLNPGFFGLFKGMVGLFKIWLLLALKFLNRYTHSFGWAIILLTVILKGLFTPFTHMSFENMKKMQALQPKLKALQERYKNDPAKSQREMMQLYKRNRVNPMAGCLPMLLQIPIFVGFYFMLSDCIELKGAPFIGWIRDLSEPDRLAALPFSIPFIGDSFNLLPILMSITMYFQQKLTPQAASTPEQMKAMEFMPLFFVFIFYKMPSGLVLYWFVNNLLSVIHQAFIKRMAVVLHHEDRD